MATVTSPPPGSTTSSKAPPSQNTAAYSGPHAVDILPTPAAQTYSHIHPTLILALYSLRFSALVADPVATLLSDLPIHTVLQVAYVVTCLPQAGSSHHQHSHAESSGDGGDGKKTASSTPGGSGAGTGALGGGTLMKAGKSAYRKKHSASKTDTLFQKLTVRSSPPLPSLPRQYVSNG